LAEIQNARIKYAPKTRRKRTSVIQTEIVTTKLIKITAQQQQQQQQQTIIDLD
jgi:hypothetical protein